MISWSGPSIRLIETARTSPEGNIGDGKIFVLPADETIQLFGEVRGPEAV